jgi:hypothetical protein
VDGPTNSKHPGVETVTGDLQDPRRPGVDTSMRKEPLSNVKVRDAIKLVERDGWLLVNFEGSHRQYKHQAKKGRHDCGPSIDGFGPEDAK